MRRLQRAEPPAGLGGGERLEPPRRPLALRLGPEIADQAHPRRKRRAAGDLARGLAAPGDDARGLKLERLVALAGERPEPPRNLRRDDALDRAAQRAILERRCAAFRLEMESGQPANQMALDHHRPSRVDAAEDRPGALAQAAEKRAGAPVDEPLHQGLVQRIGEPVLEASRPALPALGVGEPVGAIGDVSERPHPGEPGREGVDVAVDPVEAGELAVHPVFRQPPVALGQVLEHRADEAGVLVLGRLAELRGLTHFPQPHQIGAVTRAPDDEFVGRELAQRRLVLAFLGEP